MGGKIAARASALETEAAFEVLARAIALEATGRRIVHLEIGEPDFPTPPHIVQAAKDALDAGLTRYVPAPGIAALREAAADFLRATRGSSYPADQIVVAPGAKPLLFYAIQALCEPGDEVLYPDPGFPAYRSIAAFTGASPVPYPLRERNGFSLDPADLAAGISGRTKLVIVNSPSNPCGSAMGREEVEGVAHLLRDTNAFVLSDEVYWAIRYDEGAPSISTIDGMEDRTIVLDGCSKTFSMTGWRLGFAALPKQLVEPVTRLIINSVSCTAAFVQHAGVAALTGPLDSVHAMVKAFETRRDVIVPALDGIPGLSCRRPQGAFYAFAKVGVDLTDTEVAQRLLIDGGVASLPASGFGYQGTGYLRFSYAASISELTRGLENVADVMGRLTD